MIESVTTLEGERVAEVVPVLAEAFHGVSEGDETSMGVSLTTEVASNVALYEHFGYEIVGSAEVETAFTTWTMYRRDALR